jgi:hypothetical protein
VSRRSVVWLLTVTLAVVGTEFAHALAYRLVTPDEAERAHELTSTGHAYLAYAPVGLAVCSALVVVALVAELGHYVVERTRGIARPSAVGFAALGPAIFVFQEHFERLVHDGVFPWDAGLQPTFVVGLLLQLPFAGAAYLLARLLLRAVRSLGPVLAAKPRRRLRGCAPRRPGFRVFAPRVPVLALGYGSRGPPARSR